MSFFVVWQLQCVHTTTRHVLFACSWLGGHPTGLLRAKSWKHTSRHSSTCIHHNTDLCVLVLVNKARHTWLWVKTVGTPKWCLNMNRIDYQGGQLQLTRAQESDLTHVNDPVESSSSESKHEPTFAINQSPCIHKAVGMSQRGHHKQRLFYFHYETTRLLQSFSVWDN